MTANEKRVLLNSDDYKRFRQYVPLHKVNIDPNSSKVWRYYEWGPKELPPLILLPGASGTAECFFYQILSLCPKGYRLVAAQYPSYNSYERFIRGFDRFIDHLGEASSGGTTVNKGIHLFGTALGGYLALVYAQARPNRVKSLVLCNSFASTKHYSDNSPLTGIFAWTPKFLLQSMLMENFPDGLIEARIADSVDFMVYFLEHGLTQSDLSARLILNCTNGPVKGLYSDIPLNADRISIIDAYDDVALPEELRSQLYEVTLPKAHKAFLKDGGNFPYLSRPEEVNMHLEVHMRRIQGLDEASKDEGPSNKEFKATVVVPETIIRESSSESASDEPSD